MAQLRIGNTLPKSIFVGGTPVKKVYLGNTVLWEPQPGAPMEMTAIAYARNASTGGNKACTTPINVDIGFDRQLIAFVVVSHENYLNNHGDYGDFYVESHLGGQFQRLPGVFFGPGGSFWTPAGARRGSVTPFVLSGPAASSTHTVQAFCQAPYQWINSIEMVVMAWKNVRSVGGVVATQRSEWGSAALNVGAPTAVYERLLCGIGHARVPSNPATDFGAFNKARIGTLLGGSVSGMGDYATVLDGGIDLTDQQFVSTGKDDFGASVINLVGYPQA